MIAEAVIEELIKRNERYIKIIEDGLEGMDDSLKVRFVTKFRDETKAYYRVLLCMKNGTPEELSDEEIKDLFTFQANPLRDDKREDISTAEKAWRLQYWLERDDKAKADGYCHLDDNMRKERGEKLTSYLSDPVLVGKMQQLTEETKKSLRQGRPW
jgi:hypothetical protein